MPRDFLRDSSQSIGAITPQTARYRALDILSCPILKDTHDRDSGSIVSNPKNREQQCEFTGRPRSIDNLTRLRRSCVTGSPISRTENESEGIREEREASRDDCELSSRVADATRSHRE